MSYTSDTLQCILNIKQTQINVLVIQCQTHLGKIFKCTIFVGYGGVINFERCRTICGRLGAHNKKNEIIKTNRTRLFDSSEFRNNNSIML